MLKYISIAIFTIFIFSGCFSTKNILKTDELGDDVANQDKIINNLQGSILTIATTADTEVMSVVLPKDDLTLRIKIRIPNVEDVLYMNIVSNDDFKLNKLIRRVESFKELNPNQDGWFFEPSVEKNVVTLQLYLPAIYLYKTQFRPKLNFAYKRSERALQDSIQFNFIRQQYYPTHDDNGYEVAKYGSLSDYCLETGKGVNTNFYNEIDMLNKNRVSSDLKDELRGICQ